MKQWSFPVVLLVVAGVAVVIIGLTGVLLQRELDFSREQIARSRRAAMAGQAELQRLESVRERLTHELAVQTERAAKAEAGFAAEQTTTEPLRRQIEKMVHAGIEADNRLEGKNQELKTRTDELAAAREENRKQVAANQELTQRNQDQEARLAQAAKVEAELRDTLGKAQAQVAELTRQLEETRQALAKRDADYGALEAKQKALTAELEGVRKQLEEATTRLKEAGVAPAAAAAPAQEPPQPAAPPSAAK